MRLDCMELKGFETSALFYDDVNFPHGFSRSGDFSITEADTLHKYGRAMKALHEGDRTPNTDDENHFVAVCKGKESPSSTAERAWIKYQAKINNNITINAFGSSPATSMANAVAPEVFDSEDL